MTGAAGAGSATGATGGAVSAAGGAAAGGSSGGAGATTGRNDAMPASGIARIWAWLGLRRRTASWRIDSGENPSESKSALIARPSAVCGAMVGSTFF